MSAAAKILDRLDRPSRRDPATERHDGDALSKVSRTIWIKAVVSKRGPAQERDRHLCHVLDHCMRGDGSEGCFPGQRYLAGMVGCTHRTVGKSLDRLRENGWLAVVPRRRQFGKMSATYFPAVPDCLLDANGELMSPMRNANGESKSPQSTCNGEKLSTNGESNPGIGESCPGIGEPRVPRSLTETILKRGTAPTTPANAVVASPLAEQITEPIRHEVQRLHERGTADGEIAKHLRSHGCPFASTKFVQRVLARPAGGDFL